MQKAAAGSQPNSVRIQMVKGKMKMIKQPKLVKMINCILIDGQEKRRSQSNLFANGITNTGKKQKG